MPQGGIWPESNPKPFVGRGEAPAEPKANGCFSSAGASPHPILKRPLATRLRLYQFSGV